MQEGLMHCVKMHSIGGCLCCLNVAKKFSGLLAPSRKIGQFEYTDGILSFGLEAVNDYNI
jgi:hypothetical protein